MREYYENEWMPKVLPLGITYHEFWELNPHIIHILVMAENERQKNELRRQNMLYHLQGHYFADAILATVGNMFASKGKRIEYPKEPYTLDLEYEEGLDMANDEDREIARGRVNFVSQLNNLFGDIERTLERKDAKY